MQPFAKQLRMQSLIFALAFFCSFNFANAGAIKIGRFAGEFLDLGAGARSLAMGGTGVTVSSMQTSGYHNPARLAYAQRHAAELMHASYFDNLYTYDYLGLAKPLREGTSAGVTLLYARVGDIPLTALQDPSLPLGDDNRVRVTDMTSSNELALMGSLGAPGPWGWKWGGTAKLLMKSVAGKSAYGIGFDAGVAREFSRVALGITLRDLTGSALVWSTGRTEIIAPSLAFGGAWGTKIPNLHAEARIVAEAVGRFEDRGDAEAIDAGILSLDPRLGAEYIISEVLALRGGLLGKNITAGAGILVSSVTLDYAFQAHEELGNTHRVSLGLNWK